MGEEIVFESKSKMSNTIVETVFLNENTHSEVNCLETTDTTCKLQTKQKKTWWPLEKSKPRVVTSHKIKSLPNCFLRCRNIEGDTAITRCRNMSSIRIDEKNIPFDT